MGTRVTGHVEACGHLTILMHDLNAIQESRHKALHNSARPQSDGSSNCHLGEDCGGE